MKNVTLTKAEFDELTAKANKLDELIGEIESLQYETDFDGNFIENENGEREKDFGCDLADIGQITLDVLDMWI